MATRQQPLRKRPAAKGRRVPISRARTSTSNSTPELSPDEGYAQRDRLIADLEQELSRLRWREQQQQLSMVALETRVEYLSGLFDIAPTGYMVLNRAGTIMDINKAGAAMFGLQPQDLMHESLTRFISAQDLPELLKHLRRCQVSTKPIVTELTLHGSKNHSVPVELVGYCHRPLETGSYQRTAIIDISERWAARRALQESQKHYHTLVNSVEGIVWEADAETGEFLFVSRAAERILGYTVQRWLNEPQFWENHLLREDRERVLDLRRKAIASGAPFVEEFRMLTFERRVVWLRNSVNVLAGEPGQRTRLQGVMVNFTELKETEAALREQTRALETLNRIGRLLAGELDLNRLVQIVTDAGKEVSGAAFGAFSYRKFNHDDGPEFGCHASAGAPRELLDWIPQSPRSPQAGAPGTRRDILRIDDVLHDPRAPARLVEAERRIPNPPIRSYLALPVTGRDGEVLGGLFFGHAAPGVFTERAQELLTGIASQAGIALENAHLHHALARSEAYFRRLADAMPQIVWTARSDGRFDYYNRRWLDYTGQERKRLADIKDWTEFLPPEHREGCVGCWLKAVKSGEFFETECLLRGAQPDSYRWHLIRAVPIKDGGEHITRWFGTCTDIADQKQSEEKMRELNATLERRVNERTSELRAANHELEAFCYSVSHDLRAPLRSIDAFSQIVQEDAEERLGPDERKSLEIVVESARHMGELIDDLLHLSRLSRTELHRQPVSLSALAERVVEGLHRLEPKRQVKVEIAPDLELIGDERLLHLAMENLLGNAWKFTGKQRRARIEVGTERSGDKTVYFVRDNGAGFEMEYAGKLFGAFQRLHSQQEFPGNGIGLATVQRIIHRHGGRIWAEGKVGKGATFYFELPQKREVENTAKK